jgi:hypothetical protein
MGVCGCRYDAIIDLTRQLNSKFDSARETQLATRGILNSLFPSWLPPAFKVGPTSSKQQHIAAASIQVTLLDRPAPASYTSLHTNIHPFAVMSSQSSRSASAAANKLPHHSTRVVGVPLPWYIACCSLAACCSYSRRLLLVTQLTH